MRAASSRRPSTTVRRGPQRSPSYYAVPCGPINSIAEVFEDPQIKHREMQIELDHPTAGHVPLVASPLKFARAKPAYERAPPLLGQHSDEVLHELGLSDDEIASLRKEGVV